MRSSGLSVFAFSGARFVGVGRSDSSRQSIVMLWPAAFYDVEPLGIVMANCIQTQPQVGVMVLPRVLAHSAEQYILGGWSLGGKIIIAAGEMLSACAVRPRSMFSLDTR